MPTSDVVTVFTYLGFPAATAGFLVWWLVHRLSQQIERNTRAVSYLALVVARSNGVTDMELQKINDLLYNGEVR